MRKGMLVVISGPSGVGKTELIARLRQADVGLAFSVSATTRAPRPTERDGVDYRFVTGAEFDRMEREGQFLEVVRHKYAYGTLAEPVEHLVRAGRDVLLDIETQGAAAVMGRYPDCVSVFILPPSMEALAVRLGRRATETPEEFERRLRGARGEMALASRYRYAIVNDVLEQALAELRAVVAAERLRTDRYLPEIR